MAYGVGKLSGMLVLSTALLAPAALRADDGIDERAALHVLNRLSFGPAPGDLAHVMQVGIERYIDEQLHPERLPIPEPLSRELASLDSASASPRELINQYREAQRAVRSEGEDAKALQRDLLHRVALEAGEARLLQALQSPRQLQEVMVDFWFNHFNVFAGKGLDRVLVESYEREAIRPYALGHFRDLLGATAHHPAMLFYLDNWLSVSPGFRLRGDARPTAKASGLNENYARELMELHTLGVDGGYDQHDVTELARMLTGWTFDPRTERGDALFVFDPRRHDNGDKTWLGRQVTAGGQAEGEWALDVLASQPATARHISYQLAQYFVADVPPPPLVERLAHRFLETDGDIRAVLASLFASKEFRHPAFQGAKFKTPYQYVLSSLRAAGRPVHNVSPLLGALNQLGMPLYGCLTPDGYKNTEEAWLSPDAVSRRIGFASALAGGRLALESTPGQGGGTMPATALAGGGAGSSREMREASVKGLPPVDATLLLTTLGSSISAKTRAVVAQSAPALRAALVLGSPDFMHH